MIVQPSLSTERKDHAPAEEHVCARHGTELLGCKSPHLVFVGPKARRRARAQP